MRGDPRACLLPHPFLTAKIEEADRIKGLMLGGDDYILKPFSIEELGARVGSPSAKEERIKRKKPVKICGALAIRYERTLRIYREDLLGLTKTEYGILELLSQSRTGIQQRAGSIRKVRGYEGDADAGIITEHIRRIRAKISRYTDKAYIETVWGVGYRWIG